MKKLLLLFLAPLALFAARPGDRISLTEGKAAFVTVPAGWTAAALPAPPANPAVSTSVRYVTASGSNDAVLVSFIATPDDRLDHVDALQALAEESAQQFVAGSVEGKAVLKPCKIGGRPGFTVTLTDASLVGKPTVKDDFKVVTSCYAYLGARTLVIATVFTDDISAPAYTEALRLLQSISLVLPSKPL